jgi:hypothetical protein
MSIVPSHRHHPKFVPLGCLLGGALATFAAGLAPVMAQTKIPEAMRNQAISLAQTCKRRIAIGSARTFSPAADGSSPASMPMPRACRSPAARRCRMRQASPHARQEPA